MAVSVNAPPVRRVWMKGGLMQESFVRDEMVGVLTLMPWPSGRSGEPGLVPFISWFTMSTASWPWLVAGSA